MTLKKKTTIPSLAGMKKAGEKLTMITVYDYPFARLVDQTPAEMILVGDSLGMVIQGENSTNPVTLDQIVYHAKAVRKGAPNTLIIGDMPFMSYQASPIDAVRSAGRLIKEAAVDCVKIEGGKYFTEHVRCLKGAGIPVMGHIGLTPQSASALGGFKLQGKTKAEAEELIEDAIALDEAGVFAMVLECMPAGLVKKITETVGAVTISTGSGPYADGFNLNAYDLLGIFDDFVPKFVEQYKKLGPEIADGFSAFTQAVRDKTYPGPQHTFKGNEEIQSLYPN